VTIRAKLYAAIALTVLGPLVTIGVALHSFGVLEDRVDDVSRAGADQALALELKFAVTDMNGWQTAYGYDRGGSRERFEQTARETRLLIAGAARRFTEPSERALVRRVRSGFDAFMTLDEVAYRALQAGDHARVREIFLGPEIENFEAMASAAEGLSAVEARRVADARREFADERRAARRRLVAVALGAGVAILLLLLTAQDVARAALERRT
jgi:hypothetical protein